MKAEDLVRAVWGERGLELFRRRQYLGALADGRLTTSRLRQRIDNHWPRAIASPNPDPCLEYPEQEQGPPARWWLRLSWPNGYLWRMLRHHRQTGHWWPMIQ